MALDKAIAHGKERRKPYRGAKRFDKSCRNHGGCPWCEGNRTYSVRKRKSSVEDPARATPRSTVSYRARKHLGDRCEACRTTLCLEAHHRDGDHENNTPANIATLCFDCHVVVSGGPIAKRLWGIPWSVFEGFRKNSHSGKIAEDGHSGRSDSKGPAPELSECWEEIGRGDRI